MKDKILTLIIGILIGAIIATAGFIVYTKINEKNNVNSGNKSQMMMRERGDKQGMLPSVQNSENGNTNNRKGGKQTTTDANTETTNVDNLANTDNSQPPELPNGQMPNGTPPEMPNGEQPQGNPPQMPTQNNNNTATQNSNL